MLSLERARMADSVFRLPIDDQNDLDEPARRVLVIEAHPTLRSFAAALCDAFGFEGEVVAEGPWMLEAVREGRFDAFLMCIDRPVRDCFAAMQALRELGGSALSTPILAVATDSNAEVCAPVDDDGLSFVIARPVTASRLFHALTTAFAAAEAQSEIEDAPALAA